MVLFVGFVPLQSVLEPLNIQKPQWILKTGT